MLYSLELQPRQLAARGSVATVWAIETLKPHSRSLLKLLAFLDPDSIPDFIPEQLLRSHPTSLEVPLEFPKTKNEFNSAQAELLSGSLIRRNEEKGELWIHRVLQDIVRGTMDVQERLWVFTSAVNLVHLVWPKASLEGRHNIKRWALYQRIYPHILYLRTLYIEHKLKGDSDLHVKFAMLLNEAGWWVSSPFVVAAVSSATGLYLLSR